MGRTVGLCTELGADDGDAAKSVIVDIRGDPRLQQMEAET